MPPATIKLFKTSRILLVALFDTGLLFAALWLAFFLRFERHVPATYFDLYLATAPVLVSARLLILFLAGLHHWSFLRSGFNEAVRLAFAVGAGTPAAILLLFFLGAVPMPRSVVALDFFLALALLGGLRFGPRFLLGWRASRLRARHEEAERTLIVGAGNAGDLLLRDIERSTEVRYHVVGFVDDDPAKHRSFMGGKPVLGGIDELGRFVERHGVQTVLIAIPRLSPDRIRTILRLSSTQKVRFKIMPSSLVSLDRQVTAAMLNDLSPEDLLPRDAISFDPREVADLVRGRRILVTGGAGSIGSEIARQVAAHGPAELTLLDLDENELYFLSRRLREKHPELPVRAVVADIRDEARLRRLGLELRPEYVFHAAAHKHVPLMEDAPEEAVKNNVFGTLNVAKMADACGADRFVLISTDKAVRPSSVMGASKRVAEMVVRDLAGRSRTRFCAVRFGNVLGSAGSVVPLFKEQIARGGPVTVTDPECTRYFMTIPEAVGLVLLAGLQGYGELCILDMGEPIRIAELASDMIAMAGLVPGKDIPIVFTGLRPGEKLSETLLSEEEEKTQKVRNRILVAESPRPGPELAGRLETLRASAERGSPPEIRRALTALVPHFGEKAPTVTPPDAPALGELHPAAAANAPAEKPREKPKPLRVA